jgi:serine/threonine protein kinase
MPGTASKVLQPANQRMTNDHQDNDVAASWPFSIKDVVKGQARVGDYRITNYIGSGGMSTVFKAIHPDHKEPLIIKLLSGEVTNDEKTIERFILEYTLSSKINHPNVIRVYEQGCTDDYAFIAMEYLQHGNLTQRIRQGISPDLAITYATQMASALHELHQQGIVHRDIKPENILFREPTMPVLADFGIAKEMIRQSTNLTLTRTGMMVGTLSYASPEQIRGKKVDSRSDQYNLGLVLYETLTGKQPYVGKTAIQIAAQHVHSPTPTLPVQLSRIQPLLNRLMQKEPEDRYDSIDDALAELLSMRLSHALVNSI